MCERRQQSSVRGSSSAVEGAVLPSWTRRYAVLYSFLKINHLSSPLTQLQMKMLKLRVRQARQALVSLLVWLRAQEGLMLLAAGRGGAPPRSLHLPLLLIKMATNTQPNAHQTLSKHTEKNALVCQRPQSWLKMQ